VLQAYVATSEHKGHSFTGSWEYVLIWDTPEGESEIPGWSIYVSEAYFNHSELLVDLWLSFFVLFGSCWCEEWYVFRLACAPNICKERAGRVLQLCMAADVRDGQELCINYVDVWGRLGRGENSC
jgi:hypothetical protein